MALTSLEAIAQKLQEKREVELFKGNNEIKEELLRVAGKGKSKYDGASLHDQLIT